MLFSWLRNRRRRRLLAEPFPEAWLDVLEQRVGQYEVIAEADRARLRDRVRILIAEKDWEGCRGLEVTDAMRVVIAASAGILILGFEDFYFDNVQTILVYPNAYLVREESPLGGEATVEEDSGRLGEAHHHGPIILSWDEVQDNALHPGHGANLVFHEFAHKLDLLNGAADGTPNLPTPALRERWATIMQVEFHRLQRAERKGRNTLLDPYGANDPAEFFAVSTECFFDDARAMRQEYPDLYELFRDYYRQDPAEWRPF